ncbi:unnamed protein product, partial [marine sediment metagenome]
MGEPWGPPKRRLTKLDEWVGAWPADIANHYMYADWYGPSPIYTQDNFSVITGVVGTGGGLTPLVNAAGEIVEASAAGMAAEITAIQWMILNQHPLSFTAAGATLPLTTPAQWIPFVPVTVT